ncbi:MAG: AraC family transcriptional regulator [Clostridia bacterium]|nr:AraC family transcriptional regulator [Clostridia bacterium]
MFFESSDINVSIVTMLELEWKNQNNISDLRPYHALSFRVVGDAVFETEDQQTPVSSGDIVFVPAYHSYKLIAGHEHLFVLHFTSDSILPSTIKKLPYSLQNNEYLKKKFMELYEIWQKKETSYEHECKIIFYKIVTKIEESYAMKKNTTYSEKISEAIDYIHERYLSEKITIEYLAGLCYMSSTYFRKLFFKTYNTTPHDYIKNLKLKYAIELLKSGYYTVTEVSDICNFQNVYYFSSFIKKETGLSPLEIIKRKL